MPKYDLLVNEAGEICFARLAVDGAEMPTALAIRDGRLYEIGGDGKVELAGMLAPEAIARLALDAVVVVDVDAAAMVRSASAVAIVA